MSGNRPHTEVQQAAAAGAHRRGSTYVMVLGLSLVLTVIGLSALTVARVNARGVRASRDCSEARVLAFSAVEHALNRVNADADWRTTYNGATVSKSLGRGTFSWRVVDEADGDLADDDLDPATIIATGTINDASHTLSLRVTMEGQPLAVLSACLAAGGKVQVKRGKVLTLTGGILASNDTVVNDGTIYGDVEAQNVTGGGTVVGNVNTGAPARPMPSSSVFDMYKDMATVISPGDKIEKKLLSPANNPWGETNSDGIYYVDTGTKDLKIKNSRIYGTLVVKCGPGKKVVIGGPGGAALLQNYRAEYPVLIVDGKLELELESDTKDLTESDANTNLNPPGTPYGGETDDDQTDSYPNEIQGLVHVTGEFKMKKTSRVRGVIICEGKANIEGTNEIIHDSSVSQNPPTGYSTGSGQVRPGLFQRVVR